MNRFIRSAVFIPFLFFISFGLVPQEGGTSDTSEDKTSEEDAKEEELRIESLREQKRDILRYGIDSEVLDLLSTIRSENDSSFNEELIDVLAVNDNADINRAIFDFFGGIESDAGKEKALRLVQEYLDDYEFSTNLILSAVSYLGIIKEETAGDLFYEMLRDNNKNLAGAALRGIGKLEDASRAGEIMEFYEENEGDREFDDLLASAILVLGELQYAEADTIFEDVLLDEDAPRVQRQYAAVSLGKLQLDKGFDILKDQFLVLEDSNVRAYVLQGLTEYNREELDSILITALRDSFWRIRVAAGEGLGKRKNKDAVDILIYKVKKDPVRQVRYAALKALGEIATNEANDFILEQFSNERNPFDIRSAALDVMMEKRMGGAIAALDEVLQDKWEKNRDTVLGPICKTLSTTKWDELKPFYVSMLGHDDFIIRIYGVRGIKINGINSLRGRLADLDTEEQPVNVRREVKAALDEL